MGKYAKRTLGVLLALVFCLSLLPLGALADGQFDTAFLEYDANVEDGDEVTGLPETQSLSNEDDVKTFTVSTDIPVRGGGVDYVFRGWSTDPGYDNEPNVGPTIEVDTNTTLTLYAVWGEKTAKALIYDANLPTDVKNQSYTSNSTYYFYTSADYSDGLIKNYDPYEWTLVYHLPGDTGYLPILQGQGDLYISLSDWADDLENDTGIFGYPAYYNSYDEYDFSSAYNYGADDLYELSGMPIPTAYDDYGPATITVTNAKPTLTGYVFKGWSEDPGDDNTVNAKASYELKPNKSKVLYAVWEEIEYSYYVNAKPIIYDANVPSELLTDPDENSPYLYYKYGDFYYPYDGTPYIELGDVHSDDVSYAWGLVYREDYDTGFVPIYQGQDDKYVPLSSFAEEIHSESHRFCWYDNIEHRYVQYDLPVKLENVPLPTVVEDGLKYNTVSVSTQQPTLEGYVFKGWSEQQGDDNTVNAAESYQIEENMGIILYAVWEKAAAATTSTLKYDDNVAEEDITVPSDQALTDTNDPKTFNVSTDKPEREGYVFLGWSTSPGDNSVDVGATIDVDAGATKTIYAVWQAKQAITIKAKSQSWPYDGADHTLDEWEMTAGSLLAGDVLMVVITGSVHDVADNADGNNVVASVKVMRGDEDVSGYYTITTENGTIAIEPKPLTITTPSREKYYDGTPFDGGPNGPFNAAVEGLVNGEKIGLIWLNKDAVRVGEYDNDIEIEWAPEEARGMLRSATVTDDGETPTAKASNYVVLSVSIGKLRILPLGAPETPSITIKAASAEKTYDGKPLTNDEFTVDGLPEGYTVEVVIESSQTAVGTADNVIKSYVVKDKLGNDKTSDFNVTTEKGTLKVNPAPLTITADSASKLYDGAPLTKDSYTSTDLAEGDKFDSVLVTGSQTEVGSSDNVPSDAKIINAGGEDVTDCYTITYVNGTLKVTDSLEDLGDSDTPLYGGEDEVVIDEPDDDLYTGAVPLTGDESNIAFWIALAALSLVGVLSQLVGRKRGKNCR